VASCYKAKGKRIVYHQIFKNPPLHLKEAIKRIVPRINMVIVKSIVDSVDVMSEVRKEYLKHALNLRYSEIIAPALKLILATDT